MSLRHEQLNALSLSRELIRDLTHPHTRPKTIKELRQRAFDALKHFPALDKNNEPILSKH